MRLRPRIAAVVLAAAAVTGYSTLAVQGLAAQGAPLTAPNGNYQMYGNDCNNSPCGERITITQDLSDYYVRAELVCADFTIKYGGWHNNVGDTSATAECGAGTHAQDAYLQYDKTHQYVKFCWERPQNWNGSC